MPRLQPLGECRCVFRGRRGRAAAHRSPPSDPVGVGRVVRLPQPAPDRRGARRTAALPGRRGSLTAGRRSLVKGCFDPVEWVKSNLVTRSADAIATAAGGDGLDPGGRYATSPWRVQTSSCSTNSKNCVALSTCTGVGPTSMAPSRGPPSPRCSRRPTSPVLLTIDTSTIRCTPACSPTSCRLPCGSG